VASSVLFVVLFFFVFCFFFFCCLGFCRLAPLDFTFPPPGRVLLIQVFFAVPLSSVVAFALQSWIVLFPFATSMEVSRHTPSSLFPQSCDCFPTCPPCRKQGSLHFLPARFLFYPATVAALRCAALSTRPSPIENARPITIPERSRVLPGLHSSPPMFSSVRSCVASL